MEVMLNEVLLFPDFIFLDFTTHVVCNQLIFSLKKYFSRQTLSPMSIHQNHCEVMLSLNIYSSHLLVVGFLHV